MNLIILGNDPQKLAKVEAFATNLGLTVDRELSFSSNSIVQSFRSGRRPKAVRFSGKKVGQGNERSISEEGPLYGIE